MGIAREIAELIKTIQADTSRAVERMEKGTADVQAGKAVVDKAGNSFISASQLLWTGIIWISSRDKLTKGHKYWYIGNYVILLQSSLYFFVFFETSLQREE